MQTEAYVRTGDFDGARQSIRTCLEVAEKQGNPERLASAYNNMGALYHHMRDDSFSIVMYRKGLETLRQIPAPGVPCPCAPNCSVILAALTAR